MADAADAATLSMLQSMGAAQSDAVAALEAQQKSTQSRGKEESGGSRGKKEAREAPDDQVVR